MTGRGGPWVSHVSGPDRDGTVFFLVAGAPKAGTTSLHHYLSQHPDIQMSTVKEPHFFDVHFDEGAAFYRSTWFPSSGARRIYGECSSTSLYLPFVAARVQAYDPGARLICVLRDPVERAYSGWRMHRDQGFETAGFEEAVAANLERLRSGVDFSGSDGPARWRRHFATYVDGGILQFSTYLDAGYYADQLVNLFRHFDPSQVLVLIYEEMAADVVSTLRRVHAFLGAHVDFVPTDLAPRNVGSPGAVSDIPGHLRATLQEHFRPHNQRLRTLLGVDLAEWSS